MPRVAIISFLKNSISARLLSGYLGKNGFETICFFCPGVLNEANLKELPEILMAEKVSLAGISLVTDDFYSASRITGLIKEKTGLPVVWGGAHVEVMPRESLRYADMICIGEGEDAFLELAQSFSSGGRTDNAIKNIWFKTSAGIVSNEPRNLEEGIDKYYFPGFDMPYYYLMDDSGFRKVSRDNNIEAYDIITSRGCPHRCSYCYNNYRFRNYYSGRGKYVRNRSIENVIEELRCAKKIFKKLRSVNFWDDNFLARPQDELKEFARLYSKEIKLPFFVLAEPIAFDKNKTVILKNCGLSYLQMGIQTGSERVNKEIYGRPVENKEIIEIARFLRHIGIKARYDIIFNNPYEGHQDIKDTISLLMDFPKPVILEGNNLIFYPGTKITEQALEDGLISLKQENSAEDFSSIQGRDNSPFSIDYSRGDRTIVSSRFYLVNYDYADKQYLNSVFVIIGIKYIPRFFIRYLIKSETASRRLLLRLVIKLCRAANKIAGFTKQKLF